MTGEWLISDQDTRRLESLNGQRPFGVQSIHPTGRHAALEVLVPQGESVVAVWEVATGKLVWVPKSAFAITWSRNGREVFARDYWVKPLRMPKYAPITGLGWAAGGRVLVSASGDGQ